MSLLEGLQLEDIVSRERALEMENSMEHIPIKVYPPELN